MKKRISPFFTFPPTKQTKRTRLQAIGSPLTTVRTLLVLSSSLVTVGRGKRRERGRSPFAAFFRDRRVMEVA